LIARPSPKAEKRRPARDVVLEDCPRPGGHIEDKIGLWDLHSSLCPQDAIMQLPMLIFGFNCFYFAVNDVIWSSVSFG